MARDDDRHRVLPHRGPDVAGSLRAIETEAFRQLAVGGGGAEAHRAQRLVKRTAEVIHAAEVDRNGGEIHPLAGEIARDVAGDGRDLRWWRSRADAVRF